jgi:hypothetical protein
MTYIELYWFSWVERFNPYLIYNIYLLFIIFILSDFNLRKTIQILFNFLSPTIGQLVRFPCAGIVDEPTKAVGVKDHLFFNRKRKVLVLPEHGLYFGVLN